MTGGGDPTDHAGPDERAAEGATHREAALDVLVAVARRADLAGRLSTSGTAAEGLDAIVRAATVVLDAAAASIALHDAATDRLVFTVAAGPAAGQVVGLAIDPAAGIAGYAFSTGQPLAVADVAVDARFDRSVAEATGYVPKSLLATPLFDEAGPIGVLEVLDRAGGTFDLRDLEVAGSLAAAATVVVRAVRSGDVGALLRAALVDVLGEPRRPEAVDAILAATAERLAASTDDDVALLADRLARLVEADHERITLAIELVDALLRDADRRQGRGRR
jgi:GAF domain-containing protein